MRPRANGDISSHIRLYIWVDAPSNYLKFALDLKGSINVPEHVILEAHHMCIHIRLRPVTIRPQADFSGTYQTIFGPTDC